MLYIFTHCFTSWQDLSKFLSTIILLDNVGFGIRDEIFSLFSADFVSVLRKRRETNRIDCCSDCCCFCCLYLIIFCRICHKQIKFRTFSAGLTHESLLFALFFGSHNKRKGLRANHFSSCKLNQRRHSLKMETLTFFAVRRVLLKVMPKSIYLLYVPYTLGRNFCETFKR